VQAFLNLLAFCTLAAVVTASAATPKVTTIAGGYVGDGKPATSAGLTNPAAVVQDANGNLYVSDSTNCRIRKIVFTGVITTMAGTGICGYSGDGGPAKSAKIRYPEGLAFDSQGNLLFADAGNSRIRKISATGTITTIAGNGTSGYSGDGGPAIKAKLANPTSISVDGSGNVYIADTNNWVIRKVNTAGIIHTVAGNHTNGFGGDGGPATSAQLSRVTGVQAGSNLDFYIADSNNFRVRKVDSIGTITTYAGNGTSGNGGNGGPAPLAAIGPTNGILLSGGKLFISTFANVWTVDLTTQVANIVAGVANGVSGFNGDGNPALSTSFQYLQGMAFDAGGDLLIADSNSNRVRRINGSQIVTTIAGGNIGDGGTATAANLNPSYLGEHTAFDPAGNLYIADSYNNRVRKVSPSGTISTVAGTGMTGYSGDGGPALAATLDVPSAVAADGNGNVYIYDEINGVIRKVDNTGTITTFGHAYANGMSVDASGNLYVAGIWNAVVWKITPSGSSSIVAGKQFQPGYNGDGIPATQALLAYPTGVAVDHLGNLYIADAYGYRIRKVDTNGIITTVAGNGLQGFSGDGGPATAALLSVPADVAVDTKGNVYIADSANLRVRVVDGSGTIRTLAGTGKNGYSGNGLPATMTNMFPNAVAVSPTGVVVVTDYGSGRVRKIQ
jgi:hypothetical protein